MRLACRGTLISLTAAKWRHTSSAHANILCPLTEINARYSSLLQDLNNNNNNKQIIDLPLCPTIQAPRTIGYECIISDDAYGLENMNERSYSLLLDTVTFPKSIIVQFQLSQQHLSQREIVMS